jgi:hypothetical protein
MANYDIFISYSRQDKETVDMICKRLDDNNISYFRDIFDITISSTFTEALADAILSCKLVLFIASKHSFASSYTSKEVTFAYQNHIAIMPLLVDNTPMPTHFQFMFSDVQCMRLAESSTTRLISEIKDILAGQSVKRQVPNSVEVSVVHQHKVRRKRGCLGTAFMFLGIFFAAMIILGTFLPDDQPDTETEMVSNDGGYYHITSSRLLTEEDIKGFSKSDLKIMRNEIFARHGYIFRDPMLQEYFSQMPWYTPQQADISQIALSSVEENNVLFIKRYEQ